MMAHWNKSSSVSGFPVRFRIGRKLVGDRTTKSRLNTIQVTDSEFADDAALYTISRHDLVSTVTGFMSCAAQWGLTVSVTKTKAMAVGVSADRSDILLPTGDSIQVVSNFTYLGSVMDEHGSLDTELSSRLFKASVAFGRLRDPIFLNPTLSLSTKGLAYEACVLSALLYGSETWTVKAPHLRHLASFHNQCVRRILGVSEANSGRSD